jgi:hypothetical protein
MQGISPIIDFIILDFSPIIKKSPYVKCATSVNDLIEGESNAAQT